MLALCAVALFLGLAGAQTVDQYGFKAEETGIYTPLTGATILAKSVEVKGADYQMAFFNETETLTISNTAAEMAGIEIGFDFLYGGIVYDKFVAGGVGYILLGKKADAQMTLAANAIQVSKILSPRIGVGQDQTAFAVDGTQIAYKREGIAPNRTLIVEYTGMGYQDAPVSAEGLFNYQIKLYESDNHIEILFDGYTVSTNLKATKLWTIGLAGTPMFAQSAGGSVYHYRLVDATTKNWNTTTLSTANTGIRNSAGAAGSTFTKGLKYTFSLPAACETPTEKITKAELTAFSDRMRVSVDVDTTGYAEGYLIVGSEQPITENPDGKMWQQVGEPALGGTVVAVGSLDNFDRPSTTDPNSRTHFFFDHEGLKANTKYYYAVYEFNYKGQHPRYTEVKTAEGTTRTDSVASMTLNSLSLKEANFSVKPNARNEDIVIVMTKTHTYLRTYNYNATPIGNFGVTDADLQRGDLIKVPVEGSKNQITDTADNIVLYVGEAKENIVCPVDLEANTVYYFGVVSRGADGRYGTLWVNEVVLTPVTMPFEDRFNNMFTGTMPDLSNADPFIGWKGSEGFSLQKQGGNNMAQAAFSRVDVGQPAQTACLTLPPMDFPDDSNVFFRVDYELDPWSIEFSGNDTVAGDSIVFELSRDGGKTFEIKEAIHYQSNKTVVPGAVISDAWGLKQGILRMRLVSRNIKDWKCIVSGIQVYAMMCDVPRDLEIVKESIVGGNVLVQWTPSQNKEEAWDLSYAQKVGEGEEAVWNEVHNLTENQYWIEGLGSNEIYTYRVRAVCNPGNVSEWQALDFSSGRIVSFMEDCETVVKAEGAYVSGYAYPACFWYDGFADNNVDETEGIYAPVFRYYDDMPAYEWKTANAVDEEMAAEVNVSLAYLTNYYSHNVLALPLVILDPEEKPYLTFNMAYGTTDENGSYKALTEAEATEIPAVRLLISKDYGETFVFDEPIQMWNAADLAAMDGTSAIEVDLSADKYQGITALAFYISGEWEFDEPEKYIWFDNIGIVNRQPKVHDLILTSLSDQTATIAWYDDYTIAEWLVKLEGGESTQFFKTVDGQYSFEGLTPVTKYTAYVSYLRGPGDTATWSNVEFTTGGMECVPVTEVKISDIKAMSAKLTWTGTADAQYYNVRIRPTWSNAYTIYRVKGEQTAFDFVSLLPETTYEGGVQAVYSDASCDTSGYIDFERFLTREITCFAPYNLLVVGAPTHETVTLKWEGTSAAYQMEWRYEGVTGFLGRQMTEGTQSTISGLTPVMRYSARVRGVCAVGDTSAWSEPRNFMTGEIPPCPKPTDLRVESITENSAVLVWNSQEDVLDYMLRHRSATDQTWTEIHDLTEARYELNGLKPQTVYLWSVRSRCGVDDYSGWGTQTRFETLGQDTVPGNDTTAVEDLKLATGLYVAAAQGQIHVMNPKAVRIDNIRIYGLSGQRLEQYAIRSNDNVILTTEVRKRVAVVEVESEGRFIRFKIMLP